jgi:predicted alpha-1,2-mannosidase
VRTVRCIFKTNAVVAASASRGFTKRSLLICFGLLTSLLPLRSQSTPAPKTFADWVNPLIGTAKGGNVFPGADYPFGMLQWSPDNSSKPGGYDYNNKTITGFSLTHFSGRGHPGWQDFPFMPTNQEISQSPGSNWSRYAATFSHGQEEAHAGYYGVLLDNDIQVQLTATLHGGVGRFTFPSQARGRTILINAGGSRMGDGPESEIKIVDKHTVTGAVSSNITTIKYKLYFAARFDHGFQSDGTWNGGSLLPGDTTSKGSQIGAFLSFAPSVNVVDVRVAISFVSVDNAMSNLNAEVGQQSFDQAVAKAKTAWNDLLGKIQIEDPNAIRKVVFYTSLYHSFLHPNIFSDVNGDYLGFDNAVHRLTSGDVQYENISTWDGWRNQFPLYNLLAPKESRDIVRSLLRDAKEDPGGGMPRWEQANQNSGGMVGDSPTIYIASAYAYDVRDFDAISALNILTRAASDPTVTSGGYAEREHLEEYLTKGYVSSSYPYSGSIVLEYCNDDFAISRLALALGRDNVAALYLKRAQNWKQLYDPSRGYIVPKSEGGSFVSDYQLGTDVGFKEGTAQQYTWMIPFNFQGLIELMGGEKIAIQKLNHLFTELNTGSRGEYADMGNEPGNTTPWAYDFMGAPYLAQKTTREVLNELYLNTPGGLPGNDDGGAMSSWSVFASLGLFPEIPGVGGFVVGAPFFQRATVTLPEGGTLDIKVTALNEQAYYIRTVSLNNHEYSTPWIPWDLVKHGATLDFVMQSEPNVTWGSNPATAPPSFDVK